MDVLRCHRSSPGTRVGENAEDGAVHAEAWTASGLGAPGVGGSKGSRSRVVQQEANGFMAKLRDTQPPRGCRQCRT